MRIPIIAGNWKMNKTPSEARRLAAEMREELERIAGVEKVLCPPFIDIPAVAEVVQGTSIAVGAQNLYPAPSGAYTGEISPVMLKELCQFVILGHSERRAYFHEDDGFINRKVLAALEHGLTPIVCVGENLEQNRAGKTEEVVSGQVQGVFNGLSREQMLQVVIAYEPVWAIGTGLAATAADADRVIGQVIRPVLADLFGEDMAQAVRVQYGGSMNAANSRELLERENVDGGLIGGASLKANEFVEIVRIAAAVKGCRG